MFSYLPTTTSLKPNTASPVSLLSLYVHCMQFCTHCVLSAADQNILFSGETSSGETSLIPDCMTNQKANSTGTLALKLKMPRDSSSILPALSSFLFIQSNSIALCFVHNIQSVDVTQTTQVQIVARAATYNVIILYALERERCANLIKKLQTKTYKTYP